MHAMAMFQEKFDFANPEPDEPARWSTAELGIEFPLIIITGIGAVLQAAIRTGAKFMSLAQSSNWHWALEYLDGASAMIGVEGTIFSIGLIRARIEGRKKLEAGIQIDQTKELITVGVALLISIAAGMAQSIQGSQYIGVGFQEFLDWVTLFALGVGSSVLAYFAGEMTGLVLVRADGLWREKWVEYKAKMDERALKFQKEWEASDFHKMLYVDVKGAAAVARSAYRNATGSKKPKVAPKAAPKPSSSNDVRTQIFNYLDEHFDRDGAVPGPTQIKTDLKVSKGYASDMVKQWREIRFPASETDEAEVEAENAS